MLPVFVNGKNVSGAHLELTRYVHKNPLLRWVVGFQVSDFNARDTAFLLLEAHLVLSQSSGNLVTIYRRRQPKSRTPGARKSPKIQRLMITARVKHKITRRDKGKAERARILKICGHNNENKLEGVLAEAYRSGSLYVLLHADKAKKKTNKKKPPERTKKLLEGLSIRSTSI